MLIKIYAGLSL